MFNEPELDTAGRPQHCSGSHPRDLLPCLSRPSRFRRESAFGTWLTRIALNVANSYFTSRAFKERTRTGEFSEAQTRGTMTVGEGVENAELESRIQQLRISILHLPQKYREVLVLVSFEAKSYEQVAEILNIPIGTVRSRISYARGLLRERLEDL